jgi:hypothetical protein
MLAAPLADRANDIVVVRRVTKASDGQACSCESDEEGTRTVTVSSSSSNEEEAPPGSISPPPTALSITPRRKGTHPNDCGFLHRPPSTAGSVGSPNRFATRHHRDPEAIPGRGVPPSPIGGGDPSRSQGLAAAGLATAGPRPGRWAEGFAGSREATARAQGRAPLARGGGRLARPHRHSGSDQGMGSGR